MLYSTIVPKCLYVSSRTRALSDSAILFPIVFLSSPIVHYSTEDSHEGQRRGRRTRTTIRAFQLS